MSDRIVSDTAFRTYIAAYVGIAQAVPGSAPPTFSDLVDLLDIATMRLVVDAYASGVDAARSATSTPCPDCRGRGVDDTDRDSWPMTCASCDGRGNARVIPLPAFTAPSVAVRLAA